MSTVAERAREQALAAGTIQQWKQAHYGHGGSVVNEARNTMGKISVERWVCSFCYKQLIVTFDVRELFVEAIEELEYDDVTGRPAARRTLFVVGPIVTVTVSKPKPERGRVHVAKPGEEV